MQATWGEFKKAMESAGVRDDEELVSINVDLGQSPFSALNLDFWRRRGRAGMGPIEVYSCGDSFSERQSIKDARKMK